MAVLSSCPSRHDYQLLLTGQAPAEQGEQLLGHLGGCDRCAEAVGGLMDYLTPAVVELSRKLVGMYPEGPLFRGPRSKRGFTATACAAASATCGSGCPTSGASSPTPTGTASPPTP